MWEYLIDQAALAVVRWAITIAAFFGGGYTVYLAQVTLTGDAEVITTTIAGLGFLGVLWRMIRAAQNDVAAANQQIVDRLKEENIRLRTEHDSDRDRFQSELERLRAELELANTNYKLERDMRLSLEAAGKVDRRHHPLDDNNPNEEGRNGSAR